MEIQSSTLEIQTEDPSFGHGYEENLTSDDEPPLVFAGEINRNLKRELSRISNNITSPILAPWNLANSGQPAVRASLLPDCSHADHSTVHVRPSEFSRTIVPVDP